MFQTHIQCADDDAADDEHCICVQNIQSNNFIYIHCQLKGFNPILNCFTFFMERQCGL